LGPFKADSAGGKPGAHLVPGLIIGQHTS
jgi:hypothetical protein